MVQLLEKKIFRTFSLSFSRNYLVETKQTNIQENAQTPFLSPSSRIHAVNLGVFYKMEIFTAHEKMTLSVAQMGRPMATSVPCVRQSCECTNNPPVLVRRVGEAESQA
jgi:hypothetical protein